MGVNELETGAEICRHGQPGMCSTPMGVNELETRLHDCWSGRTVKCSTPMGVNELETVRFPESAWLLWVLNAYGR